MQTAASREQTGFPLDLDAIASGGITDSHIRSVLRFGLTVELRRLDEGTHTTQLERKMQLLRRVRHAPLLEAADRANDQHYAVNTDFFRVALGPRMKYSCCFWPKENMDLAGAEDAMLALVRERAGLEDGQQILDLGCGWGSLSLYLAREMPASLVTAVSNSRSQQAYIEATARSEGLTNLTVHAANIADWKTNLRFDRIVSIEMFEHIRNHEMLLAMLAPWLRDDGELFVQVFSHRRHAYLFADNWMAEHFFTGGMMPSDDWFLHFQRDLTVADHWSINGTHYAKTAQAWLDRADAGRDAAIAALTQNGPRTALRQFAEWRLFFLSCVESFAFAKGEEWIVSQYRFRKER